MAVRLGRPTTGIQIVLKTAAAFCVHGEVRDRNGVLLDRVALSLVEPDGVTTHTILNYGGRFLLTAFPRGTYTLLVRQNDSLRNQERPLARHLVSIKQNIEGLTVVVR